MDQSRQSKRNLLWWILVTAAATLLLSAAMPLLVKASPLFAGWIRSYHVWEFSGQGSISYLGAFRPSYRVVWAEIPLHKPGEYRYSFRGLPSEDNMNFSLEMPGRSNVDLLSKEWQQLVNLKTLIEVTLTDSSGRIVCKASATPGGAPFAPGDTQKWVLQGVARLLTGTEIVCTFRHAINRLTLWLFVSKILIPDLPRPYSYQSSKGAVWNYLKPAVPRQ